MAKRKPPWIKTGRKFKQMPLRTYSPEEQAAYLCGQCPELDRAVVLAFERGLGEAATRRAYLDWLEDNGVWWRLCELEAQG